MITTMYRYIIYAPQQRAYTCPPVIYIIDGPMYWGGFFPIIHTLHTHASMCAKLHHYCCADLFGICTVNYIRYTYIVHIGTLFILNLSRVTYFITSCRTRLLVLRRSIKNHTRNNDDNICACLSVYGVVDFDQAHYPSPCQIVVDYARFLHSSNYFLSYSFSLFTLKVVKTYNILSISDTRNFFRVS